jgi:hypothetical protein
MRHRYAEGRRLSLEPAGDIVTLAAQDEGRESQMEAITRFTEAQPGPLTEAELNAVAGGGSILLSLLGCGSSSSSTNSGTTKPTSDTGSTGTSTSTTCTKGTQTECGGGGS